MNECLSAVLLTPVDKREEFYHLACWLKIDLLVNFLNYFIFVLLIILHHTVRYAQLQIYMLITAFAWTFSNGFEISIKFCVFYTHIKMLWKKYLWGHISTFYQLWILTHTKRLKKPIFFLQKWIRIYFPIQFQTNKVLKSFHHKFGVQNLWIYYFKA